jgi:rare lipoprotein A
MRIINLITGILLALSLYSCSGRFVEEGKASYYSDKLSGKKMANGEKYNPRKLTAAHKTLPFGTKVKLTNPQTNRSVKVKITDRGPFVPGRIVDVSYRAANKLGMVKSGVSSVKLKVVRRKK